MILFHLMELALALLGMAALGVKLSVAVSVLLLVLLIGAARK
jgi:hypothetical protein